MQTNAEKKCESPGAAATLRNIVIIFELAFRHPHKHVESLAALGNTLRVDVHSTHIQSATKAQNTRVSIKVNFVVLVISVGVFLCKTVILDKQMRVNYAWGTHISRVERAWNMYARGSPLLLLLSSFEPKVEHDSERPPRICVREAAVANGKIDT